MDWSEPTRLSPLSTLACVASLWCCQRADPPVALAASGPEDLSSPDRRASPQRAASALLPPVVPSATPFAEPAAPPPSATSAPAVGARAPRARPTSVLVLGDSLSDEHAGGGGFVRILRERCAGVSFDNRAKGGFMVNQMRRRLENEVLPEGRRYSHAIVFGGVNDLYSDQTAHRTLPRIEADLTRIYDLLERGGTHVVAITVTPWGGFKRWFSPQRSQNTLALNGWILARVDVGEIHSATDAYPLLSCGDPERLCDDVAAPHRDGLHFGKLGHQKLARALLDGPFHACEQ